MVRNFERPGVQVNTETMNQYNKKRVIHTKLDYDAVTVRMWDAVDDRVLKLWAQYYRFYFGDGRKLVTDDWRYDVTRGDYVDDVTGWGWNPPPGPPINAEFFDSIELYHVFGGRYNKIILVRPKIVGFNHDTDDYEDNSSGQEITLQLNHEGIIYEQFDTPIDTRVAQTLSLDASQYVQYPSVDTPPVPGTKPEFDAEGNVIPPEGTGVAQSGASPVPEFLKREAAQNRSSSGLGSFGTFDFGGIVNDVVSDTATGTFENLAEGVFSGEGLDLGGAVNEAFGSATTSGSINSQIFNSINSGLQGRGASSALSRRLAGTLSGAIAQGASANRNNQPFNLSEAINLDARDVIDLSSQSIQQINRSRPVSAPQGQRRPTRTSRRVAAGNDDPGFFDQMGAEFGELTDAVDDLFTEDDPEPVPGTLP
jgi:hypothetical protein